jgi:LmbE family N-acetylglucosaminyl deacetylase
VCFEKLENIRKSVCNIPEMTMDSNITKEWVFENAVVIVAHPDDETLWTGGTILIHPEINWTILTLCRLSDPDRSPKFNKAMRALGTEGIMGDLDDGPEQMPLDGHEVQCAITELLPSNGFDLIITHGPQGEYTRHRRHEEVGKAVMALWENEKLFAKEIWRFAYEDGDGKYLPKAVQDADIKIKLPNETWQQKYEIITKIYGFAPGSFEAKTTPRKEAFWCLKSVDKLQKP